MVPREAVGVVSGTVASVSRATGHGFSKQVCEEIRLIAGIGVEGDAHAGKTVQHLSRVRIDPTQPNLRQVHLIHRELFEELGGKGFAIRPGELGENICTSDIDLLSLSRDTLLRIGDEVVLRVTGLRNPCAQIEGFAHGLLREVAVKTAKGIERRAGIMAVVAAGGTIRPGDAIAIEPPAGPHIPLDRV